MCQRQNGIFLQHRLWAADLSVCVIEVLLAEFAARDLFSSLEDSIIKDLGVLFRLTGMFVKNCLDHVAKRGTDGIAACQIINFWKRKFN